MATSYSKAYQTVTAGRVREDEAIQYFGKNRYTTPVGNFSTQPGGANTQPKITADHLNTEVAGKVRPVAAPAAASKVVRANNGNAIASAYNVGSNNTVKA
jgi:hypothetical protein